MYKIIRAKRLAALERDAAITASLLRELQAARIDLAAARGETQIHARHAVTWQDEAAQAEDELRAVLEDLGTELRELEATGAWPGTGEAVRAAAALRMLRTWLVRLDTCTEAEAVDLVRRIAYLLGDDQTRPGERPTG